MTADIRFVTRYLWRVTRAVCDDLLPQIFDAGSICADESVIDQLSAEAAYDGNLQLQRVTSQEAIAASIPASSSSSKAGTLELPPSDATSGQGGRYSGQINSAGAAVQLLMIARSTPQAARVTSCVRCATRQGIGSI